MKSDEPKGIGKKLDDATKIEDTGQHDSKKIDKQMGTAQKHGPNPHKNPPGHIGRVLGSG